MTGASQQNEVGNTNGQIIFGSASQPGQFEGNQEQQQSTKAQRTSPVLHVKKQ